MEKSIKIILSFLLIFILLIIFLLFALYFGLARYICLRFKKTSEKYIQNYRNIVNHNYDGKVIISLKGDTESINKLRPTINSLLDQTIKVNQIFLILEGTDELGYDIPDYLRDVVNIIPGGKDYGEGNKIVPILLKEKECDTVIIALDNNVIYGKDFIQIMLNEMYKNPKTVLIDSNNTCLLLKPSYFGCEILDRNKDNYDIDWFRENSKNFMVINYTENYRF